MSLSRLRIIGPNLAVGQPWTLYRGTAVPSLPVSHLGLESRQRVCRCVPGVGNSVLVYTDFGGPMPVQGVAIVAGNLTPTATVRIAGYANDPAGDINAHGFSQTFGLWAAAATRAVPGFLAAPQTYRYWAFDVVDAANPSGFYEFKVAFGQVLDFDELAGGSGAPGLGVRHHRLDPSLRGTSPGGVPYAFRLPKRTRLVVPTNLMSEAFLFGTVLPALEAVGTTSDVVLSVFSDAPGADAVAQALNVFGRFSELPEHDYTEAPYWTGELVFEESL